MVKEEKDRRDEVSAPFNMALASLERINDLLIQLTIFSTNQKGDNNYFLYQKFKIIKQLYLTAVPLINDKVKKTALKKELDGLFNSFFHKVNLKGRRILACRDGDMDYKLDDLQEHIQEVLQTEKYFMPSKNDPKYSWGQG